MIQLHTHSHYSPLEAIATPEDLIQHAKKEGHSALALTDTNALYGAVHFMKIAKEKKIKAIIGSEIILDTATRGIYLCRNQKGFQGLCLILSHLHKGSLSRKQFIHYIHQYKNDCLFFSDQKELLLALKSQEGTDFLYYELTPGQFNHRDTQWSQEHKIPIIGTYRIKRLPKTNSFYLNLLKAIKNNSTLHHARLASFEKHAFPHKEQIKRDFHLYPQAVENTYLAASLCQQDWYQEQVLFPQYRQFDDVQSATLLKELTYQKVPWRYPHLDLTLQRKVFNRIEKELNLIIKKGYPSYFLMVADIVSQAPIHCGRGSGAASIICYLLGITHVDPIAHNLFFERFLNEERRDLPDIDIDFPWDDRDKILDYVFDKYPGQAAMVANHNFLRGASAIREVAKVYGIPSDEINYITERLPNLELNSQWQEIIAHAQEIEGVLNHLSVHCGGIVITPGPIENYVPIEMARKGVPIIQWEKDQAEDAGLVKIDLLGNRSLAVIRDAIHHINTHYNQTLCYTTFNPINDEQTKNIMITGDTMGCFYIESPGTRLYLKKQQSGEFEHNIIAGSVIRPAAKNFSNEIALRIRGKKYTHLHPLLADVLSDTYGIMIYQEQVTLTAMKLADFSPAEGDELRKVLTKKHKEKRLIFFKDKFYQNAHRKKIDFSTIDKIWEMIMSFAGYSFCKPHSASYCLVSYKSAYLKCHYPAEFMAAVISNRGGFYSTEDYLDEARRMGLSILPPDINLSEYHFIGLGKTIRIGLSQIKGLRQECIDKIIQERETHGPFINLRDFLIRVRPQKKEARILVMSRALRPLANNLSATPQLSHHMWEIYSHYHQNKPHTITLPPVKKYAPHLLIRWELEYLHGAMTFSRHYLYHKQLKETPVVDADQIAQFIGKEITLFGKKVHQKKVRTRNKQEMCFVSFSDHSDIFETVFFPESYYAHRDLLFLGGCFLIKGKVQIDHGPFVIQVVSLQRLMPD